jgi:hypothetical protein
MLIFVLLTDHPEPTSYVFAVNTADIHDATKLPVEALSTE